MSGKIDGLKFEYGLLLPVGHEDFDGFGVRPFPNGPFKNPQPVCQVWTPQDSGVASLGVIFKTHPAQRKFKLRIPEMEAQNSFKI